MGPFKEIKRKKARMTILNSIILKGTWPQPQLPSRISGVVCLRPGAGILAL